MKTKTNKTNFVIVTCLYINVLLTICSCAFYAGATKKHEDNIRVKAAAAQIFDFPDIKVEEAPKTLPKKKQKARQS